MKLLLITASAFFLVVCRAQTKFGPSDSLLSWNNYLRVNQDPSFYARLSGNREHNDLSVVIDAKFKDFLNSVVTMLELTEQSADSIGYVHVSALARKMRQAVLDFIDTVELQIPKFRASASYPCQPYDRRLQCRRGLGRY